jgi:peroxiredoxin
MRITGIVVWINLLGWVNAAAQVVTISGTAAQYKGVSIEVSIPGNPFLDEPQFSETVVCDSLGHFRFELEPDTDVMIQLRTGIYNAGLFVEPGHQYEVLLPAYRELAYTDRISPYYEPLRIHLKVLGNPGDLNHEIYRFDSLFFTLNEQVILSRRSGEDPHADSIIACLTAEFSQVTSPWFRAYVRYKSGMLALNAGRTGLESISREYLGPEVRESHPAFLELFNAMFKDFLVYYNRTTEGEGIRHQINRTHSLDSLRGIILSHPAVWNDTLADLILLQELPVLFYRGDFHKEAILILLDSMEADPVNPRYETYARQLREKLSSLVIGHPPPPFTLQGTDGRTYTLDDFRGKYIYLMFCTPDHYGCMIEYPFLNSYCLKHAAYLEVVTVMVAKTKEQVDAFMERNKYKWKALFWDDQTGLLTDYGIRAFPVAYLIGPDGKLVLSPAPLPSDGFEQQLFRIMRSRGEL